MFNSLTKAPIEYFGFNDHVVVFRSYWSFQGVEIDRNGNYKTTKGENISVEKNDYLSHGVMPRGCEDLLYEAIIGDYDLDCKVGHGRTKLAAIADLMEQVSF